MVFVLETQPSLVDLNMKSKTVDLEPTDEVISLISNTHPFVVESSSTVNTQKLLSSSEI